MGSFMKNEIKIENLTDAEKASILMATRRWLESRLQGPERLLREAEVRTWAISFFRPELQDEACERFDSSWRWIEGNWTALEEVGLISATPDGAPYLVNALAYALFATGPDELGALSFRDVVGRVQNEIDRERR